MQIAKLIAASPKNKNKEKIKEILVKREKDFFFSSESIRFFVYSPFGYVFIRCFSFSFSFPSFRCGMYRTRWNIFLSSVLPFYSTYYECILF